MTEQEYRNRLRFIADDYADKKLSLSRAFACSRNPVKRIKVSLIKHPAKGDYRQPWSTCGGAFLKSRR